MIAVVLRFTALTYAFRVKVNSEQGND